MKKLLFLITFCSIITPYAQECFELNWENYFYVSGGSCNQTHVELDHDGNIVVFGDYSGTLNLGTTQLVSSGGLDIFVAKFNSEGELLWATGSTNTDGYIYSGSFDIDNSNNLYLTGSYNGSFAIDNCNLQDISGASQIFIVKLNTNGECIWSENVEGFYSETPSLKSDNLGNIFLTGIFEGSEGFNFGDISVSGQPNTNLFVTKLNSSGDFLWVKHPISSNANLFSPQIALNSNNEIYVACTYSGAIQFDFSTLTSSGTSNDILTMKMNEQGDYIWYTSTNNSNNGNLSLSSIIVNNQNELLLTGGFQNTINIGTEVHNSVGQNDVFVMKIDDNTDHIWSISFGGYSNDFGADMVLDHDDNIYLTGRLGSDVSIDNYQMTGNGYGTSFLTSIATNGNVTSLNPSITYSSNSSTGASLCMDQNNNIYTTGNFLSGLYNHMFLSRLNKSELPSLTVLSSNESIECGESTFLNAQLSDNSPGVEYEWEDADENVISLDNSLSVSPRETTTYTVKATFSNGCILSNEIGITVLNNFPQTIVLSSDTPYACENGIVISSSGASNLLWNTGETTTNITVNEEGLYSVTGNVISGSQEGCLAVGEIYLEPFSKISSNGTILCNTEPLILHANVYDSPANVGYFWSTGETTEYITISSPGLYTCTVVTPYCSYTNTIEINEQGETYTPEPFTYLDEDLTVFYTNVDLNAASFFWDFGDGNTSTEENPTHIYNEPGTYTVCLTSTNYCGQTGETCSIITIDNILGIVSQQEKSIHVFPNPAKNSFTISNAPENSVINITDVTGKIVYNSVVYNQKIIIETSDFNDGIYFLSFIGQVSSKSYKILIYK